MRSLACRAMQRRFPRWAIRRRCRSSRSPRAASPCWLIWGRAPEDVSNPDAEFTAPRRGAEGEEAQARGLRLADLRLHARPREVLPDDVVDPPFKKVWRHRADSLLEFPPVLAEKTLFYGHEQGHRGRARTRSTGSGAGGAASARLSAASPAWSKGRLYTVTLDGRVTALRAKNGKVLWRKDIPSRTESSPLRAQRARLLRLRGRHRLRGQRQERPHDLDLRRERGGQGGARVLGRQALLRRLRRDAPTRSARATARRCGAPRPPASRSGGAATSTRRPPWPSGASTWGTPTGACTRSPPAAARRAWTKSTGSYVYSGPAAAPVRGRGPTVFIGSYTGRFYALDARSGAERWSFQSPGPDLGRRQRHRARRVLLEPRDARDARPRRAHRQGGLPAQGRRLRAADLGRRDPLPDRLRDAARVQAAEGSSRGFAFGTSSS